MNGPIFDSLYNQKWYNDQDLTKEQYGYVLFENKILGSPRLRQLRVSIFISYSKIFYLLF
jgi:hypothetical protein